MKINTDKFISELQKKIDEVSSDDVMWAYANINAAISCDGKVWTWGGNTNGQLGDGFTSKKSSPGTIIGGGESIWCRISGGRYHQLAIKTDGTLWTWGKNNSGQLGDGTTVNRCSPGTISGSGTTWFKTFSSSESVSSMAIKSDRTLWTWGNNSNGQLGDGTTVNRSSPGTVVGGGNWVQISAAVFHTAAIKDDGTLWTWGANGNGYLGNGTTIGRCSPGTIAGGGTWSKVSATEFNTSAIKEDGTLWTWGVNFNGELGNGTTASRCSPGTIAGGGTWSKVSTGRRQTLAIKSDGTLWTWGYNNCGQLGDGTTISRCSPGTVAGGGTTWINISSGTTYSVALKTNGTLWSWGYGGSGNLGSGTSTNRCSPGSILFKVANTSEDLLLYATAVSQITDNREVSFSTLPTKDSLKGVESQVVFDETRAVPLIYDGDGCYSIWSGFDGSAYTGSTSLDFENNLFAWGRGSEGQFGDEYAGFTNCRFSPGAIPGQWKVFSPFRLNGLGTIAAIKCDGTLWTWGGGGASGYLADGTTNDRASPGTVAGGGTNWCHVAGSLHGVAVKTDGTLWTWGWNSQGELGNGTTVSRCSPGTIWGGGTTWCKAFAGCTSTVAIKTDGTIWTWGGGAYGELGDGTTVARCSPGTIAGGGNTWKSIIAGNYASVASIKTDGTLWTWGRNRWGELGDGTTLNRCSPGTVAGGGTTWCFVDIGQYQTAGAIKTDGTLWTWGANFSGGYLGDGTTVDRCSPGTTAGGGTTWCKFSAGGYNLAAIKTDGTLWTWAKNWNGEMGTKWCGGGGAYSTSRCSPGTIMDDPHDWADVCVGIGFVLARKAL